MGHVRDQRRPLAPWYEGGWMHVPGLEEGQNGRRVAMRAALGSVKCSSSLKASPAAGCFAYLVALLADTKRTIKVRSCFSLLLAAVFTLTGHFEFSVKKASSHLGCKLCLCGSPILFISGHVANFAEKTFSSGTRCNWLKSKVQYDRPLGTGHLPWARVGHRGKSELVKE